MFCKQLTAALLKGAFKIGHLSGACLLYSIGYIQCVFPSDHK